MMLYTKYESFRPCSFRQEMFWKLHFEKLLTPWHTYATNWNGLKNFGRGTHRDHSCEVWSKCNERFQRRCFSKKVDGRRTTDDGRRRTTYKAGHISSPWALCVQLTLTFINNILFIKRFLYLMLSFRLSKSMTAIRGFIQLCAAVLQFNMYMF